MPTSRCGDFDISYILRFSVILDTIETGGAEFGVRLGHVAFRGLIGVLEKKVKITNILAAKFPHCRSSEIVRDRARRPFYGLHLLKRREPPRLRDGVELPDF